MLFPHVLDDRTTGTQILVESSKITRLMNSWYNTPAMIFAGLFDFIDDQNAFVNTFGCNSPPLFLSTTQHGSKENSFLVTGKIDTFSMCQLFIFCAFIDN